MRISDWSSDVCSSDLAPFRPVHLMREEIAQHRHRTPRHPISRRMPERLHPASAVGKDREVTSCRGLACYLHARNFHEIGRSEEHTSELQSLMRISYAVFCLKKTKSNMIPQ